MELRPLYWRELDYYKWVKLPDYGYCMKCVKVRKPLTPR